MKTKIYLADNPCDNSVIVGDMDITSAVFAVSIEADALSAPTVTLTLAGSVEVSTDGGRIILEYPHEVQEFFKGRAYEDPVQDVVEK